MSSPTARQRKLVRSHFRVALRRPRVTILSIQIGDPLTDLNNAEHFKELKNEISNLKSLASAEDKKVV